MPGLQGTLSSTVKYRILDFCCFAAKPLPAIESFTAQVLYGMDYIQSDRQQQHEMLKSSILEHIRFHPETLLVIEEYDKLDCPTRGLLKQLVDSSHSTNVTINK